MLFFDTHTHIDLLLLRKQQSLAEFLGESISYPLAKILTVATVVSQFSKVHSLSLNNDVIYYGLGLHPLFVEQHKSEDLDILARFLQQQNSRCIAIAEIGLERAKAHLTTQENWHKQCFFLEQQLYLAQQCQLPVSLHSRQSHDQLYSFLKRISLSSTGVIHGFSGSYQQAKRFVDLGYRIGVGGVITYSRANKTRNTIKQLPLSALVLETDAPDMPLFGYQNQINHPAQIVRIFKELCELRTEPPELIAQVLWQNSLEQFQLTI